MKYVHGMTMLLSLVGVALLGMLALDYQYGSGYGLHPALAGMLSGILLYAGYFASTLIDD